MEHADAAVARLAATQDGVVSLRQLEALGVSGRMVERRVGDGRLVRVVRGVYRVEGVAGAYAAERAALLAAGERAALSHRTAGVLWNQLQRQAVAEPVAVILPGSAQCRLRGIRIHRSRTLEPNAVTVLHELRITTPERTLLDLAAVLTATELERAIARAERAGQTTTAALVAFAGRTPRHRGYGVIRRLLQDGLVPAFLRSEAEARFLELVRAGGLPAPAVNAPLHGYEVDFVWRDRGVVVEVDGRAYHANARAFGRDRRRDAVLSAAGYRVVRVTWEDITRRRDATLVLLAQILVVSTPAR